MNVKVNYTQLVGVSVKVNYTQHIRLVAQS